jgi:hypothetical protein
MVVQNLQIHDTMAAEKQENAGGSGSEVDLVLSRAEVSHFTAYDITFTLVQDKEKHQCLLKVGWAGSWYS